MLVTIALALIPATLCAQSVEQEVRVMTPQGVNLYGSLLLPSLDSEESFPVALLIAGSGPTDRNGNSRFMVNNSLKMVAEGLCEKGIASLRYDKRGVGASYDSGMTEQEIILSTFADDVALWVEYLSEQENFVDITLVGHSEGAVLALMAMVDDDVKESVERVVLLAGAGRTSDILMREQLENQPEHIRDVSSAIIDSLKAGKYYDDVPLMLTNFFRPSIQNFLIESMEVDPCVLISELQVPVLIVQGTTDIQLKPLDAESLHRANRDSKLLFIGEMNHILKRCATMERDNQMLVYSTPNLPLSEGLIPALCEFINE
ncbi:MAG: alpha/beta hydrolase [Rikenellaceae bacterium]